MILSVRPFSRVLQSLVFAAFFGVAVIGATGMTAMTVSIVTSDIAYAQADNPDHSEIPDPSATAGNGQTLGKMTNQLYNSMLSIQTFLSMLSYILGVFFSITGLQMLRANVDDPGRNPAMPGLLRLGAASFFLFAPTFANMIVNAISGSGVGGGALLTTTNAITPTADGDGLDGALIRFVKDFAAPFLENLLPFFAYVAGLIFMLVGLKRLALGNGDGPQAPGGLGTMGTFVVAACLMAFGYVMYTLQGSIFGSSTLVSNPLFKTDTTATDIQQRANEAMWGIFIFLRVVGYISVLRGLFMLRAAGEGQNVSMMAVGTHLIAGAMLANATAFVLAAEHTFVSDPNSYILQED
jgi:hypothetical protein